MTISSEGSRTSSRNERDWRVVTWPSRDSRTAVRQSGGLGVVGWLSSLLIAIYFVAKPFYVLESGEPQIADFLLVGLFIILLFSRPRVKSSSMSLLMKCLYFSIYAFFVNCIWFLFVADTDMLNAALFYIFNVSLMFVVFSHNGKFFDTTIQLILIAVVVSGVLQILLNLMGFGHSNYRTSIYFNNPNQLGYWALLSASIALVCARKTRTPVLFDVLVSVVFLYLVSLSLSKAAILSFVVLVAVHYSRNIWHVLIVLVSGAFMTILVSDWVLFLDVVDRLHTIGQQRDDNIAARGYDRLWLYPEYLILGAGEGGFERFSGATGELHSTFGAIIFSYGVIGAILFGAVVWHLYRLAGWRYFAYLLPAFAYGATHQGLRFSLIWVLFALVAICGTAPYIEETIGKRHSLRNYR